MRQQILEEEISLCFRYLKTVMIEYCFTKFCLSTNWVWSKEIVAIDNFIFHFHIWWKAIEFHLRPQGKRKGSMIFINIIKYFLDWERKGIQSRAKCAFFPYLHNVNKKEMSNYILDSVNYFVCRSKILGLICLGQATPLHRVKQSAILCKPCKIHW